MKFIHGCLLVPTLVILAGATASGKEPGVEWNILTNEQDELCRKGHFDRAALVGRKALEVAEASMGPEDPYVAYSLSNLAMVYVDQKRFALAEPLLKRALAIWVAKVGPEDQNLTTPLINLGKLYGDQGRYALAEPLFRRALAIAEAAHGLNHAEVAVCLNNLADTMLGEGHLSQAEALFQRALSIWEQEEDSGVRLAHYGLARVHRAQGELGKAETLFRMILDQRRAIYGPDHLKVANALLDLGGTLMDQGDFAGAEPLLQKALEIREAHVPDHPDLAKVHTYLGDLYVRQGRRDKAIAHYRSSVAILEKSLGPEHSLVADGLSRLSDLIAADDPGKEPMLRRALAIQERALGHAHVEVAETLQKLAVVISLLGRYEEARVMFVRCAAVWEELQGPEHPEVASALENLAIVQSKLGQFDQAEATHLRALAIFQRANGKANEVILCTYNLGLHYEQRKRWPQAEAFLSRALDLSEAQHGPDHPSSGGLRANLARVLRSRGALTRAERNYRQVLDSLERAGNANTEALGMTYLAQKQFTRAKPILTRALAVREDNPKLQLSAVAESLDHLAQYYRSTQNPAKAASLRRRAAAIRKAKAVPAQTKLKPKPASPKNGWEGPAATTRNSDQTRS